MVKKTIDVIKNHFNEIKKDYDGLQLISSGKGLAVKGFLTFEASHKDVTIQDTMEIRIDFPNDYPNSIPDVREIGGRIPMNFHINPDGTLCLGASFEIKAKFATEPTLKAYLNKLVIPFLYSYCYKERYGNMPYGERPHGALGVLEAYKDYFNTSSEIVVIKLLNILAENNYRGHSLCPCGSNIKLRYCHGPSIINIIEHQKQYDFMRDLLNCLSYLYNNDHSLSDFRLDIKELLKKWKALERKEEREHIEK